MDFKLPIKRTFCNVAVRRICHALGYDGLEGQIANQMVEFCLKKWIVPCGDNQDKFNAAGQAAEIGDIAILGAKGTPPGHVAIVHPGKMLYSGTWSLYCPLVANVGKDNKICGANYAFPVKEPTPEVFILGRVIA